MTKVPELLMDSFNALMREVAVLGLLGLLGYAVIESDVMTAWAKSTFPDQTDSVLQELFEHVQFYVCVMALLFVVQGSILLSNAYWVSRKWHNFEVTTIDTTVFAYTRAVREKQRNAIGLLDLAAQRRHRTDVSRMEFAVMRRDFMRPRLADLPLDSDFRFSEYLSATLSRTLSAVLEVPVAAWVMVEATFVLLRLLMGTSPTTQVALFTVVGYLMVAAQVYVYRTLSDIYQQTAGDSPTLHEMAQVIEARGHELQEAEGGVALMEELIAVFLHPSRLVPQALLRPVKERVADGYLYSRLTPQQALFPLGSAGPTALLFAIRFLAFAAAAYAALIAVSMAGVAGGAYGAGGAAAVVLLMAVPPAFMMLNLGRCVELYSVVTSQEDLRDDDLVHRTLQRQFAQQERSARTLLSALAVGQAASKGTSADETAMPSAQEVDTALRAAFNSVDREGRGYVERVDLGILLQRVGLRVSPTVLEQLSAEADADGSGQIRFESFRTVALRIMAARVDVRRTIREAFTNFQDEEGRSYPDGKLTAEPFQQLVTGAVGSSLEDEAVDFLFRDADDDEDGFVTWEQFASLMLAHANRGVLYEPSVAGSESYSGSDYSSVSGETHSQVSAH